MKKEFIEKIKSRGYWRVNFQPLVDKTKLKSLGECKSIVEKNCVQFRGWDYPHFPRRKGDDTGLEAGGTYWLGWIDWNDHKEFWRMYQSGQFLHYRVLVEDWSELDGWDIVPNRNIEPGKQLSIIGTTYFITEIFQFASKLARAGIYDEGVRINIDLKNTEGRKLVINDPGRWPLMEEYKASMKEIPFSKQYTKEDLITKPQELAFDAIIHFFERFGWDRINSEIIKKDQSDLLNRSWS